MKADGIDTKPLVVLLVEDNLDHAEMVKHCFKQHSIANVIRHVTDGEMALDYLLRRGVYIDAASSPRPHAVLLDLRLPKVDGIDVLKQIKTNQELRHIPVIILTTSDAELDIARAYDNYTNSYLVKPLDFMKFTEQMETLGFYWLDWNQSPQPGN